MLVNSKLEEERIEIDEGDLHKVHLKYVVVKRRGRSVEIVLIGRCIGIKGVNKSIPRLFSKRSISENLEITNNSVRTIESSIYALSDLSIIMNDVPEIGRSIKRIIERMASASKEYYELLLALKNLNAFQTAISASPMEVCDLCNRPKFNVVAIGEIKLCNECRTLVKEKNIKLSLLEELWRIGELGLSLLMTVYEKPFHGALNTICKSSEWYDALSKLESKKLVTVSRKVHPNTIAITPHGTELFKLALMKRK